MTKILGAGRVLGGDEAVWEQRREVIFLTQYFAVMAAIRNAGRND
jgi:hypothetical protein